MGQRGRKRGGCRGRQGGREGGRMAQTYRGQVRRREREIRAAERCPLCERPTLCGLLIEYRGVKACPSCHVNKLRSEASSGDHPAGRREEACVDEGGADGEVYGQDDGP